MTKVEREHLLVLMLHAARDVAGVGCGLRPEAKADEKARVRAAYVWAWGKAYGARVPCGDNELYNAGLL